MHYFFYGKFFIVDLTLMCTSYMGVGLGGRGEGYRGSQPGGATIDPAGGVPKIFVRWNRGGNKGGKFSKLRKHQTL